MTKIQWTEETWNPVIGCTPVSEGCRHCYAAQHALRLAGNPHPAIGPLYTGLARTAGDGRAVFTGAVRCLEDRLGQPLRWKKPRQVFVNSMSDLFHPAVPREFLGRVLAVMAGVPRHTFQVLTKRPERMKEEAPSRPLPNVWLGVSVEDQATAEARIPLLLQTPAAVRFVSFEPALGPVDLAPYLEGSGLGWVICGGESGPRSRPCNVGWLRDAVRQCKEAGVPVFVKQLGADPVGLPGRVSDPKGGSMEEWPPDLRVREVPGREAALWLA